MTEQTGLQMTPERIEEYLQARQGDGLTENTLQTYRAKLNRIYEALPADDKTIYRGTIQALTDRFSEQGFSNQALNVLLATADSFVLWCERPELQASVRLDRGPTVQPELTRAEYLRLLSAAKTLDKEREYLIIKTIVLTGVTVSEVIALTVEAAQRGWLATGEETRRIPDVLRQELLRYARRNGLASGMLFRSAGGTSISRTYVTRAINSFAEPARVEESKCNPRCLRRLYQETQAKHRQMLLALIDQAEDRQLNDEQRIRGWAV